MESLLLIGSDYPNLEPHGPRPGLKSFWLNAANLNLDPK